MDSEEGNGAAADSPIEVARITIVKSFDPHTEGGMRVGITYSEGLTLLDAVGMLAFANNVVYGDYGGGDDE